MISRGSLASFSSSSTTICRQHGVGPPSSARHPSSHFKVLIKPAVSTPLLSRRKASSILVNAGSPFQLFNRGPFTALRPSVCRSSVSHSLDPSKIQSTVAHSEGKSIISSFSLFFVRPERRLSSSPPPPWPLDRILSATLRFSTYLRQERSPLVGSSVQTSSGASLLNVDTLSFTYRVTPLNVTRKGRIVPC